MGESRGISSLQEQALMQGDLQQDTGTYHLHGRFVGSIAGKELVLVIETGGELVGTAKVAQLLLRGKLTCTDTITVCNNTEIQDGGSMEPNHGMPPQVLRTGSLTVKEGGFICATIDRPSEETGFLITSQPTVVGAEHLN